MKTIVICHREKFKSLAEAFLGDQIFKFDEGQSRLVLYNGDTYVWVGSNNDLRGKHGWRTQIWGDPPAWVNQVTHLLVKTASRP